TDRMGGTLTNDVDGTGRQQRNACLRRQRHESDVDLVELQFLLGSIDDLETNIDRVPLRLTVRPQIGQGNGCITMPDGDSFGLGDALHDRTILCRSGAWEGAECRRNDKSYKGALHRGLPVPAHTGLNARI